MVGWLGKRVPQMRLTWKDAVSAVFMAAIAVIYAAFLNSTTAWLISSSRGTAAAVLVLGIVGGCGMSNAAEQYRGGQPRAYMIAAVLLGTAALTAGVLALITASIAALAVLVGATFALWLAATARHAIAPASPGGGRDAHEVIDRRRPGVDEHDRPGTRSGRRASTRET